MTDVTDRELYQQGLAIEKEFCDRYDLPYLNIPPTERLRAIFAYRNDRRLYRRKCDSTGVSIISAYRPDCGFQVVTSDIWWGDSWEGIDYGSAGDPQAAFFPQFSALQRKVPREGTSVVRAENCEYNSHVRESKNCYLSSLAIRSENLLYCYWTVGCRDLLEGFYSTDCELCARCSYVTNCYQCAYLSESANCNECYFSSELRNCKNCLFCCNLSNQNYCIRNQPCSPEEFERERQKYFSGDQASCTQADEVMKEMLLEQPRRAQHSLRSESVLGDHILNSRDVYHAFDVINSDHCFNLTNGGGQFVVHGYSVGFPECQHVFSSVTVRNSSQIFFAANCWNSFQLWYCDNCVNCKNCFGCVGLKNREFCIFNVQCNEQEYHRLFTLWKKNMVQRGEWGHFFPIENSPFCYDESVAGDFFPLSRAEILNRGWRAVGGAMGSAEEEKSTASHERQGQSRQGDPDVGQCKTCQQHYRIVPAERKLCSQFGVPYSLQCPDCRLSEKLHTRNPYSLQERSCLNCKREILTNLSPSAAPSVWCENCFIATVF